MNKTHRNQLQTLYIVFGLCVFLFLIGSFVFVRSLQKSLAQADFVNYGVATSGQVEEISHNARDDYPSDEVTYSFSDSSGDTHKASTFVYPEVLKNLYLGDKIPVIYKKNNPSESESSLLEDDSSSMTTFILIGLFVSFLSLAALIRILILIYRFKKVGCLGISTIGTVTEIKAQWGTNMYDSNFLVKFQFTDICLSR